MEILNANQVQFSRDAMLGVSTECTASLSIKTGRFKEVFLFILMLCLLLLCLSEVNAQDTEYREVKKHIEYRQLTKQKLPLNLKEIDIYLPFTYRVKYEFDSFGRLKQNSYITQNTTHMALQLHDTIYTSIYKYKYERNFKTYVDLYSSSNLGNWWVEPLSHRYSILLEEEVEDSIPVFHAKYLKLKTSEISRIYSLYYSSDCLIKKGGWKFKHNLRDDSRDTVFYNALYTCSTDSFLNFRFDIEEGYISFPLRTTNLKTLNNNQGIITHRSVFDSNYFYVTLPLIQCEYSDIMLLDFCENNDTCQIYTVNLEYKDSMLSNIKIRGLITNERRYGYQSSFNDVIFTSMDKYEYRSSFNFYTRYKKHEVIVSNWPIEYFRSDPLHAESGPVLWDISLKYHEPETKKPQKRNRKQKTE